MKNLAVGILIIVVIVVLGFSFTFFQVRETEIALRVRLGKADENSEIKEPGIYSRWPAPIDRIYKYDSRMRVFEADLGETTTKGAVPIIVNTYVVWNISEPLAFFNAVGSVKEAESKLLSQISNTQNKIIGQHNFSEFVNSDPAQLKFDEIQQEMLADLRAAVKDQFGINIKTLGIKQLKVNKDVTENVFERMKAERQQRTQNTLSEGQAEKTKIVSDADAKKKVLLAATEARAKQIRGQGDAEAAKYYKMLDADPELAMFLRDIDALKTILASKSTIVLSADSQPFELLKRMPEIKEEAVK
ncbi:MAG TPA: protease modulator HflC [Sedimentisphaerales bacterium]|nr:protease modulator HflC [Sedimentisphaerales bacterium]